MRKLVFALSSAALALAATASPAPAKTYVCTKWDNGVCVSTHRVKGAPPYAVGYVFGPNYSYTTLSDIPQPVTTYYKLGPDKRYVYSDGYLYEVDPATYAVTQVIDTYSH
ncbi:MAG TPA: hypothetical protein VE968_02245 [Sphingomicrobium sp.]|nr:hypothetical protein [Sphingomicrobium sp.]